jgi:hypothetical protein
MTRRILKRMSERWADVRRLLRVASSGCAGPKQCTTRISCKGGSDVSTLSREWGLRRWRWGPGCTAGPVQGTTTVQGGPRSKTSTNCDISTRQSSTMMKTQEFQILMKKPGKFSGSWLARGASTSIVVLELLARITVS